MTKREAAILTAHTGIFFGHFDAFHEYVENIMDRPVFSHEMGNPEITQEIKDRSEPDFIELMESIDI